MPLIQDIDRFIFVVGAPRSGTTTMARMLRAHPQILFPFVKEPHFFAQFDLRGVDEAALRERIQRDYLDHFFSEASAERNVGADGSVSYLYTPEQLEPVLKLWPRSRFIVGVRDPLTLLPSLHKRLLYTGDEHIRRFEDAWKAVPDRAAGRRIARSAMDPRFLRYDQAARFGTYVERLFKAVGPERCLVVVFDELVADPAALYHRLTAFAGLSPQPVPTIRAERESTGVRSLFIQRLLKRPPRPLLRYLASRQFHKRFEKDADPAEGNAERRQSLRKRIIEWNRVEEPDRPVPLSVQREIQSCFQEEVDKLGALIGRDLSHWLKPKD
jgi:hypothetical protein